MTPVDEAGAFLFGMAFSLFFVYAFGGVCTVCSQRNCLLGPELELPVLVLFGAGEEFAAGDPADVLEDACADLFDGLSTFEDAAGREVYIARHAFEDGVVGSGLDDGGDSVADGRPAPRRKDDDGRSGRDQPRC